MRTLNRTLWHLSVLLICTTGLLAQWQSYNNTLDSQRFSTLTEITVKNVSDLKETCEAALGDDGAFEAGPLVVGDTLYVTTAHTTVALNAADCSVRWRRVHEPQGNVDQVFAVNRGVAYLDGRIFRGTVDGFVVALDGKTGAEVWRVSAADPKKGEFFSAAPIAWNGLIFLGPAGSDWGARGRVAAFDAATGKEVWRFDTVPMGNEPGADTWEKPATAKTGGGATWTSYTLDTSTGELFVPVANPWPDFLSEERPGANLYTNSVVVLDAKTGKLKWYYQLVPNDALDWDLAAAPMLYKDQSGRQCVALASKDGYVYVLDRASHKPIFKTAVTTVGSPNKQPPPSGVRVCPGALGGVEWNGPAYNPNTAYMYVGSVDWCATLSSTSGEPDLQPGKMYMGTGMKFAPVSEAGGWITALNSSNGKVAWHYKTTQPVVAGITPTAGGVVFGGDLEGNFLALDATSGKLLAKTNLGGALAGGIITYSADGHQYVATTAGNVSRMTFGSSSGTPRLVIMTTGLKPGYQPQKVTVQQPEEVTSGAGPQGGKHLYAKFCSGCHGPTGEGGVGPQLKNESSRKNLDATAAFIKNPQEPMPKLYPSPMSEQDVNKVAAYVQSLH